MAGGRKKTSFFDEFSNDLFLLVIHRYNSTARLLFCQQLRDFRVFQVELCIIPIIFKFMALIEEMVFREV